jgi:oligopeptide/dipeptide ABC transporter ATP-binding protein
VSGGEVKFDGADVTTAKIGARRKLSGRLRAVFQNPFSSFDPRRTIGASLAEPLRLAGVKAAEADARARAILEAVGLPASAVDRYPREFSGGQRQRIAIARALITNPELVICDEPVSALDLSTQAQVLNLLADLRDDRGLAYLFIAHDIAVVEFLAQYVVVLYRGQVMEEGPPAELTHRPRHPYTQALLAASPVPRPAEQAERRTRRENAGVKSASVVEVAPAGCPFAARCPLATELCRTERPELRQLGAARVACHYAVE